jgi:hypothetical protein
MIRLAVRMAEKIIGEELRSRPETIVSIARECLRSVRHEHSLTLRVNPKETGEEASSPELKKEARQSPIHYRARIELHETKFRNLPEGFALRPGMRVVCDIKFGRRSILEYVLNPITRVIGESLREP